MCPRELASELIGSAQSDPAMLAAELWSDGELFGDEIDLALAEALRDGGPWGQAFPEPQFDGCFDIVSARVVGERHVDETEGSKSANARRHRVRRL